MVLQNWTMKLLEKPCRLAKGRKLIEVRRNTRESSVDSEGYSRERNIEDEPTEGNNIDDLQDFSEGEDQEDKIVAEEGSWTEESEDEDRTFEKFLKKDDPIVNEVDSSSQPVYSDDSGKLRNILRKRNIVLMTSFFILLLAWVVVPSVIKGGVNNNNNNNNNNHEHNPYKQRLLLFYQIIREIQKDFPSQNTTLWETFYSGIKYVNESKPIRPAVFLLLHNNDRAAAECLAWRVGKAASTFLETPGIIELPAESTFDYTDHELVAQYREQLKKKGVMIVYRLDEIPGLVAQSFHTFCDTYNPLVRRAVLLFTLNSNNTLIGNHVKANKKAMELMKMLWKDTLIDAKLDPLITRLTDTVLEVRSEKYISCF